MASAGVDRNRVRRGRRGDSIIFLRRGLAGKRKSHIKIIRSLGLSRLGDQNLGFADDPCRMGQFRKAQHLLGFVQLASVENLDADEEPHRLRIKPRRIRRAGKVVKTPPSKNVSPTWGRMIDLQGMQFVRSQVRNSHSCTVTWSSSVELHHFLHEVHQILGLMPQGSARFSDLRDGLKFDDTTETVLNHRTALTSGAVACRAQFAGAIAYWQSADGSRELDADTAEVGLVFEKTTVPDITQLMLRTGTIAVKGWAEQNSSEIEAALLRA